MCPSPGLGYAVISSSPGVPGLKTQGCLWLAPCVSPWSLVALCLGHSATRADQAVPILGRMSPQQRERVMGEPLGDSHSEAAGTLLLMCCFLFFSFFWPKHSTWPNLWPAGERGIGRVLGAALQGGTVSAVGCAPPAQSPYFSSALDSLSCRVALGKSLGLSGPRSWSTASMP